MGPVVEGSLPDVEPPHSDVTTAGIGSSAKPEPEMNKTRKNRRNRRPTVFRLLKRLWIPLIILAVIGAGGLTVSRLHGIFGSEKSISYGDTRNDSAQPLNPKYVRYEIFGPAGTVAQISYFDGNGDPKFIEGVSLPWSLEFPISTAASIGSIAAQGDSDSIGCRILVDGVVKSEKITEHEASSFSSCVLKAA
jgi:hypothetical protein